MLTTLLSPPPTPNRAPLRATGRAGRNLPAAVGIAVVLIAIILASLLVTKVAFVGLVVVAVCGALWELDYEIGRASCRKECRSRWSPYH